MSTTPPTTLILFKAIVNIHTEKDVSILKQLVNEQAAGMNMGILNKTRLITATSELACNMLKYAGGGYTLVEAISRNNETGIRITCTDKGPGIPDIALVMQKGYSTGNTLGLGLPGAQHLTDEFAIISEVNKGTTVTMIKWAND